MRSARDPGAAAKPTARLTGNLRPVGGVHLQRRPVVAILSIETDANTRVPAPRVVAAAEESGLVIAVGGNVDSATHLLARGDIAITAKELAGRFAVPPLVLSVGESGVSLRIERATFRREPQTAVSGSKRQHLHDPAEGVSAIEVAGRTAHHLHAVHRSLRHPVPVHPAAEWVIERYAVGQHEGTARA